jgi:hypothetical protein
MASFSAIGGALKAMQDSTDDEVIVMLGGKAPLEVLSLALTSHRLKLHALLGLLVSALFNERKPADFRESFRLVDDLYAARLPAANLENPNLREPGMLTQGGQGDHPAPLA